MRWYESRLHTSKLYLLEERTIKLKSRLYTYEWNLSLKVSRPTLATSGAPAELKKESSVAGPWVSRYWWNSDSFCWTSKSSLSSSIGIVPRKSCWTLRLSSSGRREASSSSSDKSMRGAEQEYHSILIVNVFLMMVYMLPCGDSCNFSNDDEVEAVRG